MHMWIDEGACPAAITQIALQTAERMKVPATVVTRGAVVGVPKVEKSAAKRVKPAFDMPDIAVVDSVESGDLVVTSDLSIASAIIAKGGYAIDPHGEVLDDAKITGKLALRNAKKDRFDREQAVLDRGPTHLNQREREAFANELDALFTRIGMK